MKYKLYLNNYTNFIKFVFIFIFISTNKSFAIDLNKFSANKHSYQHNSINNSESIQQNNFKNSISLGIDELNGVAHEIVYNYGKKISHLEWNFKDVKMLTLDYGRQVTPDLGFNITYSNSIDGGSRKSSMVDSDWLLNNYDDGDKYPNLWSDRSFHELNVQRIQKLDIKSHINLFNPDLRFNLGYRYQRFKFHDYANNYIYSSDNDFRDEIGNFGWVRGVSYEQMFYVPYLGLELNKSFLDDKFIFNIYSNYTPIATAKDIDNHHMRGLEFTGNFKNVNFYNWGVGLSTKIYPDLYLGTNFDYTYYALTKGSLTVKDYANDESYNVADDESSGIKNKTTQISLFLKYNFNTQF